MRNEKQNDTIAAIATPPGEGGIAIVRISGARAGEFLHAAFRPAHRGEMKHGQMRYGTLTDPAGTPIDEVMAVFFRAPRSYTREDVAEIHLHGGTMCARAAMERLLALGARAAEPGEFTYRAFMNGRVDLSEAEAIMGLIGARSQAARRASIRQLRGGVSAPIGRMREELTGLLAKIEAATDFPDEIDEDVTAKDVREGASRIRGELSRAADGRRARIVRDGASVVLCGRPNVGKSSLTNRILGENRMIVANEAGTTRDAIDTPVDNAYGKFIFTDTAGLRKRSNITDGLERYMVVRALAAVERSRVALILVDATVGFTEQDSKVAGYAHDQGKACIIVVNKWDAVEGKETNTMELQRRGYAECFSFMGYAPIIFISAQTGYNVNKLMQLIRDVDSQNGARVPTGVLNEMLARATARMQPPSDKGRRLKIFYLTQASTRPPTFVAFVNAKHLFHFSYQRYIINQIRENFGLEHTPIRLVVRERGSGEVGAKDV